MTQYIDKSAVVAEIKRLDDFWHLSKSAGGQAFVEKLLSFLNTLEVKKVDLEKEVNQYVEKTWPFEEVDEDIIAFAKHFFELGLKIK